MSLFDELNNFDNNAFENLNEIKKNAPDFNTIISDIDVPGFPDYESPFGNNSPFASTTKKAHFFTGSTYINKLVDYLNKGSFLFRHSQFLADKITTIPSSKKFEHYLLGHYNHLSKHKGAWLSGKSNIAYKSKLNDLFFDVHLSSSEEHSISKRHPVFAFTINFSESTFRYRVLFQFNGFDANAPFAEQYGINIETASYTDLESILTDLKLKYPEYLKEKIIKVFKNAFVDAGGDRNKLDELYVYAPKFVIASRATPTLLADLNNILTGFVDEIGTNEEIAVLNILRGLHSKLLKENKKGHDDFLNTLLKPYDDDTTYFERIYDKLNDTGGNNNFKAFIDLVYAVWAQSNIKDISRYTTLKDPGPQSLGYTSKKILGFYTDGFNFEFETVDQQRLIRVTHTQKTGGSIKYGNGAITTKNIGYYHPFQPLFLPEITNQKGVIKLPNRIIPAFYLKAFDDKNSWSNFEKQVWLAIDVITTITGVGNLLKFRHLAKLQEAKAVFSLKLGLATIEVTSGTLGILLNFVNDCDPEAKDKNFCQYLREFLIILDIATLSIDGIDNLLRLKARQAIDEGNKIIANSSDANEIESIIRTKKELRKFTPDNIVGKGIYGGKILTQSEIDDWAKLLFLKYKTKLQKVERFDEPDVLAAFNPQTNTIKYKEGVTEYIFAHESYHAREMSEIGASNYMKDIPLEGTKIKDYTEKNLIRRYLREKYVRDLLLETADELNLNGQERWHIVAYFYEIEYSLIEKGINLPK